MKTEKIKIWIDLDNSPHVPFFSPIIKELERKGFEVIVTARDAYQVYELADLYRLTYHKVGRHYGKNKFKKLIGTFYRAMELRSLIGTPKPMLSVSHGSRSQIITSRMFRIPSLLIFDYEHSTWIPWFKPNYWLMPEVVTRDNHPKENKRNFKYPGIKEDVYVPSFIPDPTLCGKVGIDFNKIVVLIRPPAEEAHYHKHGSDDMFALTMEYLGKKDNLQVIVLPRNERQKQKIMDNWASHINSGKIIIPSEAVDGLSLIYYSDLVISGGGTMNREAAALGVPVYSIFRGTIGAVDRYLKESKRLIILNNLDDIENKLVLTKRPKRIDTEPEHPDALGTIVNRIENLLDVTGEHGGNN